MDCKTDDIRVQIFNIMTRIKKVILTCVLMIQCLGFQAQVTTRSLEDLERKLENYSFSEVSSLSVLDRILYGRSIFIGRQCPYGTVRIGRDCVKPRSDYEYSG